MLFKIGKYVFCCEALFQADLYLSNFRDTVMVMIRGTQKLHSILNTWGFGVPKTLNPEP